MLSIITPTLNSSKFIEENIKSIKKLNIPFEHIVVDGGSSDSTIEKVLKYPHVRLIKEKNKKGMYSAIHQGFVFSVGDALTWVNSDDQVISEGYEQMYHLLQNENLDFVYGNGFFVDINGKKIATIKGVKSAKFFLKHGIMPFLQPASIYRKDLYCKIGGLRYNKFKIVGDFDLFNRMAFVKDVKFGRVNTETIKFLKYGESLGDKNGERAAKERNTMGFPYKFSWVNIVYKIVSFFS